MSSNMNDLDLHLTYMEIHVVNYMPIIISGELVLVFDTCLNVFNRATYTLVIDWLILSILRKISLYNFSLDLFQNNLLVLGLG